MKTLITLTLLALTWPALSQTMYKCPDPAGIVKFQQMPCSPQGGGEAVPVKAIPAGGGSGLSDNAKAYLQQRDEHRAERAKAAAPSDSPSLSSQIEIVRKQKLAEDCYALEKRIYYIQNLEKKGAHVNQHSIGDEDSRNAIAEYKRRCGHWGG